MKSVALSGNKRTERGASNANSLRKEKKVPCNLYGGKESILFAVEEIKFNKLINTPEVQFVDLDIDGAKFKSIIKEVQFHPVTDRTLHVDFLEVANDKSVAIHIPVTVTGTSKGVLSGGKLRMVTRKLKVIGLPAALPETIELDITELNIGQTIKVGDIKKEGLTFLDAANAVVLAVKMSRAAVATEGGEEVEEHATESHKEAAKEETAAAE